MAVVAVRTPLYSNSGSWKMADPPHLYQTSGSESLASMAYQYPLPPSGLESSNMIPGFHHLPMEPNPSIPPPQGPPMSPQSKARGTAASSKSKVKKSLSTPNVRGQASADAAALALSAEKRRNKLGYHRTSVACGHCRRRKIRCIPAPNDSQNRCSNCIRLKKECIFLPVESQTPTEPRRRGSQSQSGTGRASESSSPSASSTQLPEIPASGPYPHLNMPPIQDLGGPLTKRQRTESFSPETRVVASSRNFDYSHGPTNWMAPDASPSTKPQPDIGSSYWRMNSQESPMTPAFSPFTPSLPTPSSQNWASHQTEPSPREELSWSAPQRSISYSNLEGLQQSGHQQAYSPYPPRMQQHAGMYPPPISTSTSAISTSEASSASTGTPQHSHSAGALPGTFSTWQQPPYAYPKSAGSSLDAYGSWSSGHGGQPQIPEEGQTETAHYSYGEPGSGGVFYPGQPPHPQGR